MIIGLTPFLYLYDNRKIPFLQDGNITIYVSIFSCKWKKSKLFRMFLLTVESQCGMISLLGGL